MKKAVVVYQSKYGSTKKYAQWIAQELSCDIFERKDIEADQLNNYDVIIYGGGLYAGRAGGIDLITKSFPHIKDKNIIVFTCGLADLNDSDNVAHIKVGLNKVLTPQMQNSIKLFHMRGGIDYSKLSIIHKSMMAMLHKMILKKDCSSLRQEDKQFLETYGKAVDFTDKNTIKPLVAYVKELSD